MIWYPYEQMKTMRPPIDILDARCLYAVACNKHTRDMYEANIGAVLRHLLDSHHHPGKEDFA